MKKRFPKRLKYVFLIGLLFDFSYYVYLTVFALYLNQRTSLLNTSIIIAGTSLVPIFAGFFSEKIEKKLGTFKALFLSFCIWAVDILLFVILKNLILLIGVALFHGFSLMISKPVLKSLYSRCQFDEFGSDQVHRVRYIEICVAGLTGPLVGGVISDYFPFHYCFIFSFLISILIIILLCCWKKALINENVCLNSVNTSSGQRLTAENVHYPKKIKYLLISYIICVTLIYMIFTQFESVFSLVLDTVFEKPAPIYSYLLSLNSLWGIILQLIIVKSMKFKKLSACHGIFFFQLGFLLYAFSFYFIKLSWLFLFIGVFIYSIGEVITIPALEIEIDGIAPDDKKTLFFGIAEIRGVGVIIGPIIMTKILTYYNAFATCIFSIIVLAIALVIELINKKISV